jgi:hypothetical protein
LATKAVLFQQQEQAHFFIKVPAGGLTITPDGNIGIGTDQPDHKLEVNGSFQCNGAQIKGGLFASGNIITTQELNATSARIMQNTILHGKLSMGAENPLARFQIGNSWTFDMDPMERKIIGHNTYLNGSNAYSISSGSATRMCFNLGDIVFQTTSANAANSILENWNTVVMKNNGDVGIGIDNPKTKTTC